MAKSILKTKPAAMQRAVKEAPLLPGCYIYRNKSKKILYIGKAKVLRNRVKSYFNNYNRVEEKIRQMIDQAMSVEFITTDSEIEALILESNLIKKYKPKYNSMLVDDKSYVYVQFDQIKTTKPGHKIPMPTIHVTRERISPTAVYFGPYPDSRIVKRLLRRLRKLYPYSTSKTMAVIPPRKDMPIITDESRPNFYAQIGLSLDTSGAKVMRGEYERNLNSIKKFFKGEKGELQSEVESEMKRAAKNQDFELAARFRNMLNDIRYVGSNLSINGDFDEVMVMQQKLARKEKAVAELIDVLQFPKPHLENHPGFKIECYDISNIQGTNAVGSMVVFVDGEPRPELYRRFRIRMKNEPNDFAMLQEVLTRRINRLGDTDKPDVSFGVMPDLMIIDGGKGQLSSTFEILQAVGLDAKLPIVGLAKREEEIFKVNRQFSNQDTAGQLDAAGQPPEVRDTHKAITTDDAFTRILLPRRSEALHLVQRIRDEAHRFAITYHRKLRSKQFVGSKT